jgi:hypothetical protein
MPRLGSYEKCDSFPCCKLFLNPVHDTFLAYRPGIKRLDTSGTVMHAYHLLSQYRDILLKLLHDHTEVFGASTAL